MEPADHLWEFIPARDFEVPHRPETVPGGGLAARLWHWIRHGAASDRSEAESGQSEDELPDADAAELTPAADWSAAARELARRLKASAETRFPIQPLIGPPGSGVSQILRHFAEDLRAPLLKAPATDVLLSGNSSIVDIPDGDLVLIPNLEHWYVRHEEGLHVMRELLRWLAETDRRVLVGCESWAWAYLQTAVGVEDILGDPWTLAPFGASRLCAWLGEALPERARTISHGKNGPSLLTEDSNSNGGRNSTWIHRLAEESRGNPGVAAALWRSSLRRRQDARSEDGDPAAEVFVDGLHITPLPQQTDRFHFIVLHAVLLHGELRLPTLRAVLGRGNEDLPRRVSQLVRTGVLAHDEDRVRVNLAAYPAVRSALKNEGFLVDAF